MLPIIILVLWFAIYFQEVLQVRLKLQEAARFATWEYTAYPLHDYEAGRSDSFDDAEAEITELTMELYEDLDSSDRRRHPGDGSVDPGAVEDQPPARFRQAGIALAEALGLPGGGRELAPVEQPFEAGELVA